MKRIDELQTGERVRVSGGAFSKVFMWTHHDRAYSGTGFVRLLAEDGRNVTATIGHLVYVCQGGRSGCSRMIVGVEDVVAGDAVWVVQNRRENLVRILRKQIVAAKGLFNPHTLHGDIVVNGILFTCYTRAVPIRIAHSAQVPLRALYGLFQRLWVRRCASVVH